jgi:hypothetical protein
MKEEINDENFLDIVSVKELKDGSANITIDVSEEFLAFYRKKTGKKRATKKGVSKYIQDHLGDYLSKKIKTDSEKV